MKESLFNIDSRLTELYSKAEEMTFDQDTGCYVDPETGEVLDIDAEIEALGGDRKKKLTDTALYVTRLLAESEMLKARAKAIGDRAKAKANLADRLKRGIASSMVAFGDKKIESDDVVLTTRQSTSVDILDESVIPEFVTENRALALSDLTGLFMVCGSVYVPSPGGDEEKRDKQLEEIFGE